MNTQKNYYKILGVSPSADFEQIKSAYKNLVKHWHPDLNCNSTESRLMMKELNEAYEVLSDETSRELYNIVFFGTPKVNNSKNNSRSHLYKETEEDKQRRARVQAVYTNKKGDKQKYYDDFAQKIEEGKKERYDGGFSDKLNIIMSDAKYFPFGFRILITPFLICAVVFWHACDLLSRLILAFIDAFTFSEK